MDKNIISIIEAHFNELKKTHKNLELISGASGQYFIRGTLGFTAKFEGEELRDSFEIEVAISEYFPKSPPRVKEVGGRIPVNFHKLRGGFLCLAAPLEARMKFSRKPTLLAFINNFVVPYLYSFCCWEKNKEMPYGERSHLTEGILEQYRDIFNLESNLKTLCLIKIVVEDSYRGHIDCPCGNGVKLRNCHGPTLLEIKKHKSEFGFFMDYLDLVDLLYKEEEVLPRCLTSKKILRLFDKYSPKKDGREKEKTESSADQKKAC